MAKKEPREYQLELISKSRISISKKNKKILLHLPTGGGKTVVASVIIEAIVAKLKRALFTCHRRRLIFQTIDTLSHISDISLSMGKEGFFDQSLPIQIGMLHTLKNRMKEFGAEYLGEIDVIIIDEVQYGASSELQKSIFAHYPDAIILGLSATPCDAQGFALQGWDDLVSVVQTVDLVEMGYLLEPICLAIDHADLSMVGEQGGDYKRGELSAAVDTPDLVCEVFSTWKKYAYMKKTFVFAVDISHAEHIADEFRAGGVSVGLIHSRQSSNINDAIFESFSEGGITVLVSVDSLGVGVDEPSAEVALIARPTKSIPYFLQMVGRVMRLFEGMTKCMILDLGDCIRNCGHPLKIRDFTVPRPKRVKKSEPEQIQHCERCKSVLDTDNKRRIISETPESINIEVVCRICDAPYSFLTKTKGKIDKLKRVDVEQVVEPIEFNKMTNKFTGYKELRKIAQKAGYKNGWAWNNANSITKFGLWSKASQIFSRVDGMGLSPNTAIQEIRALIGKDDGVW